MHRSIMQSVGKGGVNVPSDVNTVQELINANLAKIAPLRPLSVDGRIGPMTIGAIEEFQRRVVGLARPDGRVDPAGRTLAALNMSAYVHSIASAFRVVFQHHSKTPDSVKGAAGTNGLYESTVSVVGSQSSTFRGSIYPDDMSVKGRLKDGTYDLYLGFHKRQGHTPAASDLVARAQGFRAALVVNADRDVPVISNNAGKTTSNAIHAHNGFESQRYSDGCPTLHPLDWTNFIQIFLKAYPNLSDWTSQHSYLGTRVGTLEIRA